MILFIYTIGVIEMENNKSKKNHFWLFNILTTLYFFYACWIYCVFLLRGAVTSLMGGTIKYNELIAEYPIVVIVFFIHGLLVIWAIFRYPKAWIIYLTLILIILIVIGSL